MSGTNIICDECGQIDCVCESESNQEIIHSIVTKDDLKREHEYNKKDKPELEGEERNG